MRSHEKDAGWLARKLRLLALSAVLILAACASRPSGLLAPVAPTSGGREVSVLAVSTREPAASAAVVYSGRRGDETSLSIVDVSIPPGHRPGRIETPRSGPPRAQEHFAALSVQPIDEAGVDAWLATHARNGRVLIYVHGFNMPFDHAVFRVAQIATDSRLDAAPVLFAWPSRGSSWAYLYDRESANFSRDALERVLRQACLNPEITEVNILAHSMGAWLVLEALRQAAIRDGALSPKLRNVVLASPDLDVDVFMRQFDALGPTRPHFTFLISRRDFALRVSRLLAGGVQRLGAADPQAEPFKTKLESTGGVTLIDLSGLARQGSLNHSKYASSPEVVKRLGALFIDSGGHELPGPYGYPRGSSSDEAETEPQ